MHSAAELVHGARPLLLAHRGDSRTAPENTLPAFASALDRGADLVELDYLHSLDGVPFVFHDEELDRTTDACRQWGGNRILPATKTWAELSQLDAGSWFAPSFSGTRLPTLEQALTLILPRAGAMIERKAGDARMLVELLRRIDALEQVVIAAFDWQFLADVHQLAPSIVLEALGSGPLKDVHLDAAATLAAAIIGWNNDDVTEEHILRVQRRGMKAWVWTVDAAARAAELVRWGVNGVISNVPSEVAASVAGPLEKTRLARDLSA